MKCRNCDCCTEVEYTEWDYTIRKFVRKTYYECWGVKEPFRITDIDRECTEYPEKNHKNIRIPKAIKVTQDFYDYFVRLPIKIDDNIEGYYEFEFEEDDTE